MHVGAVVINKNSPQHNKISINMTEHILSLITNRNFYGVNSCFTPQLQDILLWSEMLFFLWFSKK